MLVAKQLLIIAIGLAVLFAVVGCASVFSRNSDVHSSSKDAGLEEVTGKLVGATPCGTLVRIETVKANETETIQFMCLDPEIRESVKSVKKGDMVKVQYVFSPETQRNSIRTIQKAEDSK